MAAAARKRAPLRAVDTPPEEQVEEEEQVEAPEIGSLLDAIERGTYEDVLVWQRKDAVKALSGLTGPALAAMHRQIAALSKDIEALRAAKTEETDIGDAIETPDEEYDPEAD